jgi:molybdate transport system substrate-binding protein
MPPSVSRSSASARRARRPAWRGWVAALAATAVAATGCVAGAKTAASPVTEIHVAAASDLRPAFEEIGRAFREATGTRVTFSFGSSGQLRQQIINGAPFDLFASASVAFVDDVIAAGRGIAATKADYAFGRIVLVTPSDMPPPASVEALRDLRFRRIAIANPGHAPYGLAAEQALRSAGIYDQVVGRLVYGENIADTFHIVQSGNADVGIVALSLAIAAGNRYTLIPADLHEPLEQALVVTSTGARGEAARAFARFVGAPAGRAVMVRYGFLLPGESLPGR